MYAQRNVRLVLPGKPSPNLPAIPVPAGLWDENRLATPKEGNQNAEELAASIGGNVKAYAWTDLDAALGGAGALINGTSLGLEGNAPLQVDLRHLPKGAPVMDMVYRPLRTAFLQAADERGHPTIDGLDMLIGQAKPSFEAFFGRRPPAAVDVRTLCLDALERRG